MKPTLSSSGKGVKIYSRKGDVFLDKSQQTLTLEYLNKAYKSNYLISEFFHQSDFMQKFNQSSVNTIRMATYRDRKGCVHVLRTIVRMGGKNAEVDNAHAGGVFCGVDEDGNLGNYVCDWLGNTGKIHNGIDFSKEKLQIPGFEAVKEFAIETHKYIIHHDLLALDIVLDKCNRPQLLEINCEGFGGWLFQFTSGSMFAQYTDENGNTSIQTYSMFVRYLDKEVITTIDPMQEVFVKNGAVKETMLVNSYLRLLDMEKAYELVEYNIKYENSDKLVIIKELEATKQIGENL